ncbi:hypothetical protein [uncultured Dysosmobacter sp.]|uniref:hypothetical protein n=1 Tax=uncultured Dysosmobacter sp. TaxID=2591384 RepID=UPI0026174EC9|nr:hypothetical protein [uncultured Dysosmobacter sp.]
MRRIRCYECGKSYDYDEDGFCPKCGAFNQPPRSAEISSDGSVVRRDGLNERNHSGSFAHEEFHEENRERKALGLSKGVRRAVKATVRPATQASKKKANTSEKKNPLGIVVWIVFAIIALNILSNFFFLFF